MSTTKGFQQAILLLCGALVTVSGASAAEGPAEWRAVRGPLADLPARAQAPANPRLFRADLERLRKRLAEAPPAQPGERGVPISLPLPDGRLAVFLAVRSPLVEPGLRRDLPTLQSYRLQGRDDPSAGGRINLDAAGLRAMLVRGGETIHIEPWRRDVDGYYASYTRAQLYAETGSPHFACEVGDESGPLHRAPGATRAPNGSELRSYRIAVAGTTEFTADQGGAAAALASIADSVMRLNVIFERELAVHLDLVANNANIVYTGADPYTNGDPVALVAENQANLDDVATIGGSAAYDIGHVFGTWAGGGSGFAGLRVVCDDARKGRGSSSSSSPAGDAFIADLLAHEIGHQFGANHSFNGTTSNCGPGRAAGSAWEPASGTTIMSYAGICGAENIQNDHDTYFHIGSIEEMLDWLGQGTGASCGTFTATGNSPPQPDAGMAFTLPVGTPFALSGAATDADNDTLTYTWEQFDLGSAAPPNVDNGSRPIFRSFPPGTDPVRTLPRFSDILTGTESFGETLPATDRTLTFRFAVRDNNPAGGGIDWDEVALTTTTAAGPFRVTSQADGGGVPSGAPTTVEWDVAGTDLAPVSCASVDIDLSTDSGQTFTQTLATGVPNSGSATVTMPAITTVQARLRVACSDNIFFAVNDTDFGIGTSIATVCSSPGLALGEATSANDSLNILDTGNLLDVNVSVTASMNTFVSTAGFTLAHLGSQVTLTTSSPDCFGDDIDAVFDDEAGVDVGDVCGGTPAISGSVRPVGTLADFDSADQSGQWTLTYNNNFLGCSPLPCTGVLEQWCVTTSVELVGAPDTDGDGVSDDVDNCLLTANPDQNDADGDLIGNVCDADLDNDCEVGFTDLNAMKLLFFSADPVADLDGDGEVGFTDLNRMKLDFFNPPGPSANGCN